MFNMEKAHFILEEMISNGKIFNYFKGCIIETNKSNILDTIITMDKISNNN
jgi:hypothetical protein